MKLIMENWRKYLAESQLTETPRPGKGMIYDPHFLLDRLPNAAELLEMEDEIIRQMGHDPKWYREVFRKSMSDDPSFKDKRNPKRTSKRLPSETGPESKRITSRGQRGQHPKIDQVRNKMNKIFSKQTFNFSKKVNTILARLLPTAVNIAKPLSIILAPVFFALDANSAGNPQHDKLASALNIKDPEARLKYMMNNLTKEQIGMITGFRGVGATDSWEEN